MSNRIKVNYRIMIINFLIIISGQHAAFGQKVSLADVIEKVYFFQRSTSTSKLNICLLLNDNNRGVLSNEKFNRSQFEVTVFGEESKFIQKLHEERELYLLSFYVDSIRGSELFVSLTMAKVTYESYTDPKGHFQGHWDSRRILFCTKDRKKWVFKRTLSIEKDPGS